MFNDAERRRLEEIESEFRTHDPVFVRRFEQHRGRRWRRRAVALLALVTALAVTVIALVSGNVPVTVMGLVAVGATVGLVLAKRAG
jgi:Flp pilus assembly protein TadB